MAKLLTVVYVNHIIGLRSAHKASDTHQCRTQSFLGHVDTCAGTGTLTKVLERAPSDRQSDKSYGSI